MRSFQIMRNTRRMSPPANDLTPTNSLTPELTRRSSVAVIKIDHRPSCIQIEQTDDSNMNR